VCVLFVVFVVWALALRGLGNRKRGTECARVARASIADGRSVADVGCAAELGCVGRDLKPEIDRFRSHPYTKQVILV
jgi:hypothetical protein